MNEAILFKKKSEVTVSTKPVSKIDTNKIRKQLFDLNSLQDLEKLGVKLPDNQLKTGKVIGRKTFVNFEAPEQSTGTNDDIKEATPGRCDPKPVCITNPLDLTVNPENQVAFPPCINIHHCGGCCSHNEICVAVETDDVKLTKVGVIEIRSDNQKVFNEEIITVKNHTACECQCQYNTDESCKEINPNYIRDPYSCGCICPGNRYCGPFHEFDETNCTCICNRSKYSNLEQICRARNFYWNESNCRCESMRFRPK